MLLLGASRRTTGPPDHEPTGLSVRPVVPRAIAKELSCAAVPSASVFLVSLPAIPSILLALPLSGIDIPRSNAGATPAAPVGTRLYVTRRDGVIGDGRMRARCNY